MAIRITNLQQNQVLYYPLALLRGDVLGTDNIVSVTVQNLTDEASCATAWPVVGRHFRALVQLVSGHNVVRLSCYKFSHDFPLQYQSLMCSLDKYVRLVYVVCKDNFEEGHFQGPPDEDCSVESACKRISLGAQILQTAVAETLSAAGFLRKTFCLEESDDNSPVCHVFQTSLTSTQVYKMSGEDVWQFLTNELTTSSLMDDGHCKFLVFLSCTRYMKGNVEPQTHSEVLSRTKGHVMIGGGGVALCGTGCLYTWAECLSEVPRRMGDLQQVDRLNFMDDSNYRGTRWACYSSSLGGVLHELGHVFDLVHTEEGIMGQGFHDMHQLCIACDHDSQPKVTRSDSQVVNLTLQASLSWSLEPRTCCMAQTSEPPSISLTSLSKRLPPDQDPSGKKKLRLTKLNPKDRSMYITSKKERHPEVSACGLYWSKSCAIILNYHKWLNPTAPSEAQSPEFDGKQLTSKFGIRLVEFREPDSSTVLHFWEFPEGREEVPLGHDDVKRLFMSDENDDTKKKALNKKLDLLVIDTCGNILRGQLTVQVARDGGDVA